jgi:hypothetical protein
MGGCANCKKEHITIKQVDTQRSIKSVVNHDTTNSNLNIHHVSYNMSFLGNPKNIKIEEVDELDIGEKITKEKKPRKSILIENKNFISENESQLELNYKVIKFLGQGAFGTVHKVLHKTSGMFRAMKTIKKSYVKIQDDEKRFLKEIEILVVSNHPNIIKLILYITTLFWSIYPKVTYI